MTAYDLIEMREKSLKYSNDLILEAGAGNPDTVLLSNAEARDIGDILDSCVVLIDEVLKKTEV